jgi:transmembrane sensor
MLGAALRFRGEASDAQLYRTAHGEQRVLTLEDGSVLHLNSDSALAVHFTREERLVSLERGQALFQVAHDRSRRFRVDAGLANVVAIGTQFDIDRRDDEALVTVVDGKVAVSGGGHGGGGAGLDDANALRLVAGQQAQVAGGSGTIRRSSADLRSTLAWTRRQIVLDGRTVADVVREFNRYASHPIVVVDPALAATRLGGVIDAYDTASFLEFLKRFARVDVTTEDARIVVRSKSGATPPSSTQ